MAEGGDLVVIGSYVQDHVWALDRFPAVGETLRATGFSSGPGGKGFNQAVAAHRQQARTVFLGAIGQDSLGAAAQEFARAERLPCRWLRVADAPTAAAGILVDAGGRNQVLVALGANERLSGDWLAQHDDVVAGARLVLLQLENNLEAIEAAIALAGRHGVPVALNPAPMHPGLAGRLLAGVALLTPNETEFAMLVRNLAGARLPADQVAALSDDAVHAYARKLGVGTVVITLGEHGCFVSHGSESRYRADEPDRYRVPAETACVVDTTGAGDAFNGALAAVLAGQPDVAFRDAVAFANLSAALSTETIGAAIAMPTRSQVRARWTDL